MQPRGRLARESAANAPLGRIYQTMLASRPASGSMAARRRGSGGVCWDESVSYPAGPACPGRARRFCSRGIFTALSDWPGRAALAGDLALIASELATNAVVAGCQEIGMRLVIHHDLLRLTVRDDAPGYPILHHASPDELHGRGLEITQILSQSWGVEPVAFGKAAFGKQVWAELAIPPHSSAQLPCVDRR